MLMRKVTTLYLFGVLLKLVLILCLYLCLPIIESLNVCVAA